MKKITLNKVSETQIKKQITEIGGDCFTLEKTKQRKEMVYTNAEIKSHILSCGIKNNIEYIIINNKGWYPCCYLGIPLNHPLTNKNYNDIPLQCHGGLTFGKVGEDGSLLPSGKYWLGWDYGHCDDYVRFLSHSGYTVTGKKWTLNELEEEIWTASFHLEQLLKLLPDFLKENKK